MKKYNVIVKRGIQTFLYAGVSATSHKEAKEKVRRDAEKKPFGKIKSITSEIVTDHELEALDFWRTNL